MSTEIKIKRGSGTTPALADGELGYNKDTKILTIGTDSGNVDVGRPILTMTQAKYNTEVANDNIDDDTIYIIESADAVVTQSALSSTLGGYVPTIRKVNGKALSGDITLAASDVSARPSSWTPSAADVGAVPTTRKVNGKALSSDITLSASDVSARPSSWTPSASDVGAVPTSRTVNGKALSSNITLSASDVGARASSWTPTASDVGAAASSHTHVFKDDITGTVSASRGGTGRDTLTSGRYLVGNGTSAVTLKTPAAVLTDIGAMSGDVLWTNASPSSEFAAQTVTVSDMSNYQYIIITAQVGPATDSGNISTGFIPVTVGRTIPICGFFADFWMHVRQASIASATQITFTSGYMYSVPDRSKYENWNGRTIPLQVIGIKGV